jgi:4-hydroxy-2-oxoheptanedioate aldolase
MIEGVEGFRSLRDIIAVPGWDVIFVGPYDLSQSLGHPGEIDHPEVVGTVEQIVETVKKSGRFMGIFADNAQIAQRWIRLGVQFIALSVDTAIFYQACKKLVTELRG